MQDAIVGLFMLGAILYLALRYFPIKKPVLKKEKTGCSSCSFQCPGTQSKNISND